MSKKNNQGLFLVFKVPFIIVILSAYQHFEVLDAGKDFINIDCGVEENYYSSPGVYVENDTSYVEGGKSMPIATELMLANIWKTLWNLRSFPQGKRHCYSVRPKTDGEDIRYLISAFFMYGNYDGKNKPPKFDLYVGTTYWETVQLQLYEPFATVYIDAIYVVKKPGDTIDVCLVDTDSGTPIISFLQIRPLKNDSIYPTTRSSDNQFFSLYWRTDCGTVIPVSWLAWYPDDVYRRTWLNYQFSELEKPINITQPIFATKYSDPPPVDVLRTAIMPSGNLRKIEISYQDHPISELVFIFHFAEIESEKDQRKFTITLNNGATNGPYFLEYLKPLSLSFKDSAQGGIKFAITATNDSLLPPILNAYEIFKVVHISEVGTDDNDVTAIKDIKQRYGIVIDDWQGDPCVPLDYIWSRLQCNTNKPPRIISLNLSSSGLEGDMSASFSQLKSLQILDLSYNNLTGPLPEFFGELLSLKFLNLTGNQFEGSVPKDLWNKYENGELTILSDNGNQKLCFPDPCKRKSNTLMIIVVVAIASIVMIIIVLLSVLVIRNWLGQSKKQRALVGTDTTTEEDNSEQTSRSCRSRSRRFTYSEIVNITNDFSSLVGEGGFGKVYLGKLQDDRFQAEVAVKLLSPSSRQGQEEFQNEVELLMGIHHKNLVSLFGYCNENDGKMAIVYEYVTNGSLEKLILTNVNDGIFLSWKERLQIALGTARGLEYLHNDCKPPIVHRDMKMSNILLTEKLEAKISDFGLGKLFPIETASYVSSDPKGTIGYLDPEYHYTGKLNKKSDVYSFGVVLLELITGQAAIAESPPCGHIIHRIRPQLGSEECLERIVDTSLVKSADYNPDSIQKVLETAMACVAQTAVQRPDISQVCNELKESLKIEMASESA